jgi:hypothetical protein
MSSRRAASSRTVRVTHYQVTLNLGYEAVNQGATDDFYFQRACGSARNMTGYHTMEARL